MLLAQVTDTHVLERDRTQFVDNNALLAAAVAAINAESPAPDAVLGTGDLTNWAKPGQYEMLAELVEPLAAPFWPLVGNHDDRDRMRQTFPAIPWTDGDHASWVTEIEGTTVIGLDSTEPGGHGGAFDDERRAWLTTALDEAVGPVILALHHPPFDTGVAWMDAFGFAGRQELTAVIGANAERIQLIVCGHLHRAIVTTVAGVTTSICPSTAHHVELDLAPASRPMVIRDPRAYQLHLVSDDAVVTHTRFFDTGEAAFDPGWDTGH